MGFTIPRVDSLLAPYVKKSYDKYKKEHWETLSEYETNEEILEKKCDEFAIKKVYRDIEQGVQAWEYRYNSLASSRGDYPFVSISCGLCGRETQEFDDELKKFAEMITEVFLLTRAGGEGKEGFKKPVLFPKLTFMYDEEMHGKGKELEYLFDLAIECSRKSMYPDYLSMSGDGYIPNIYKKYGTPISLMGKCKCSPCKTYRTQLMGCA